MSVDMRTSYLGLKLRNPLVASASPLTGRLGTLRQLEEAGAAAVVLPSLFEEQVERDERAILRYFEDGPKTCTQILAESPELDAYNTGPAAYLRHVRRAKSMLSIPVIASLNGTSKGHWTRHARLIEEAGADALELNVGFVPTDPEMTAAEVEHRYLDVVAAVSDELAIPLAVKLGPYFSALPNLARRLVQAGADGLVLFNRDPRPDDPPAAPDDPPRLALSTREEVRLPLRWITILRPQLGISLAASSGIHTAEEVVKLLQAGADVTMTASALLRHGPSYLRTLLDGLRTWMEKNGVRSVAEMRGPLDRRDGPETAARERSHAINLIATYRPLAQQV
jgi:dihydroorotate dehydrogenase (fumarate)